VLRNDDVIGACLTRRSSGSNFEPRMASGSSLFPRGSYRVACVDSTITKAGINPEKVYSVVTETMTQTKAVKATNTTPLA